nr:hypothetical protein [Actinomadura madurae]
MTPSSSRREEMSLTQVGSWLCQTRVCPRIFMPRDWACLTSWSAGA